MGDVSDEQSGSSSNRGDHDRASSFAQPSQRFIKLDRENRKKTFAKVCAAAAFVWLVVDKASSTLLTNLGSWVIFYEKFISRKTVEPSFSVDRIEIVKRVQNFKPDEPGYLTKFYAKLELKFPEYSEIKILSVKSGDSATKLDTFHLSYNKVYRNEAVTIGVIKEATYNRVIDNALKLQKDTSTIDLLNFLSSNGMDYLGDPYGSGPSWQMMCTKSNFSDNFPLIKRWSIVQIEFIGADSLSCIIGSNIGLGDLVTVEKIKSAKDLQYYFPTKFPFD